MREALAVPGLVEEVFLEPDAPGDLAGLGRDTGATVHECRPGALAAATSPVTPQAAAAIARIPAAWQGEPHGLVLVLVDVGDPGNAGTIVRVAEAAGATAVVSCGDGVDLWNPKCVRAAAGSLFRMPVRTDSDALATVRGLAGAGMRLLATVAGADRSLDAVDLTGDVAVLLGNEAHGLRAEVAEAAEAVGIPMAGRVESLNVAMAATVVAFEAARQRRDAS